MGSSTPFPDDTLLAQIEAHATELARGGGAILNRYFGSPLEVKYKDKKESDPVTVADTESQDYLAGAITERYPGHGIVGEEDDEDEWVPRCHHQ